MEIFKGLQPELVWSYFEEICKIPRPSKKEEKIAAWLMEFAKKHQLEARQDEAGNVLITKPATPGKEQTPGVVLQAHMDMVCEKNADTVHDFDKDPIKPYIDGEWVKAKGTTLGADDGIGIAAALAVLTDENIQHGPLECLFTVDEETGLTGAFALQPGFFQGKILLNLDSEDEGEIFIGCAGGIDTVIRLPYRKMVLPAHKFAVQVKVKGLQGGHSGDDINKGRGNAIKILNRFLWDLNERYGLLVASLEGGNLRNAIAREANAVIVFDEVLKENIRVDFNMYAAEMEEVWKITEPGLQLELESVDLPGEVLTQEFTNKLLNALYACPHGVFAMSYRMPGMVETSTNLAAVKFIENDTILITTDRQSGTRISTIRQYFSGIGRPPQTMFGSKKRDNIYPPGQKRIDKMHRRSRQQRCLIYRQRNPTPIEIGQPLFKTIGSYLHLTVGHNGHVNDPTQNHRQNKGFHRTEFISP